MRKLLKRNLVLGDAAVARRFKKHQAKQADDYEEDEAESSQLASSAFMAAPHFHNHHWLWSCCPTGATTAPLTDRSPKGLSPQPFAQYITMERVTS